MKKTQNKDSEKRVSPKKISTTVLTSIVVAVIGCLGTLFASIIGYLGIKYQVDQTIKVTQPLPTIFNTLTPSPTSIPLPSESTKFSVRLEKFARLLPDTITPEDNSFNTLSTNIEINNLNISFMQLPDTSYKPAYAEIYIGHLANDKNWINVSNQIEVKLEFFSDNIPNHVNLFYHRGMVGGGGGEIKYFDAARLSQDDFFTNQFITSLDYDYFSLQPGESELFAIPILCKEPGIYEISVVLNLTNIESSSEQLKINSSEKIMCPKEYSLWVNEDDYSAPLRLFGNYSWNGQEYDKSP